ncbi:ornithine cyclodeaminase [Agromyces flavus]|uniref:Ornithine cyclodeaminase n=1 Tax=Agromyces flavus TaxID=589382 RepID=A0A1H1PY11_9MICO|nr:ornithine cyclodeaminase family protein [Agromyces flavus]MCP2367838.1 ornithine cyclodeaminase [Agromyces flavus]GGI47298.1 alanine dehydrogenase [Agromyces flavus]SDS16068.1 ornithine cyclodeaminase [Agromyces flavus]
MAGVLDSIQLIDGVAVEARVTMRAAIRAVQELVRGGFDPDSDPPRGIVDVPGGQLLLMPSAIEGLAGQKLATVAPGNPARGLERIQAVYVVLDGDTLAPVAIMDGTALTSLRTPAVSAAVLDATATPDASSLVVFGTGPQGLRHVEATAAVRDLRRVRIVGRDRAKAERASDAARAYVPHADVAVGGPDDVAGADLVVCASTATEPLFGAGLVSDRAAIVAVGSHEPDQRELPGTLLGRAQVIVETGRIARTEAGDVIMAVAEGHLSHDDVVPMARILDGRQPVRFDRPRVFKTCGMGWQDLAVARLALETGVAGAGGTD